MSDTASRQPSGTDGDPIDGAVLIRTGGGAPRRDGGFTRIAIDDDAARLADAEGDTSSPNGAGHAAPFDTADHVDARSDTGVVIEGPEIELAGSSARGGDIDTRLLRERLIRLHDLAGDELERRRGATELAAAETAPVPVDQLSSFAREIPRLARGVPHAAAEMLAAARSDELRQALRGVTSFMARQSDMATRHGNGQTRTDEFGFDVEWTESLLPLFRFLYEHYWRVRTTGMSNVPADGRALLVSNHAGVLPFDGAMIRTSILLEHPAPRHARALIMDAFFGVPFISWFLRRTGNTLAHPDDAERLLECDELVLVFPEGVKGTGKPYRERYRLRRFGRGGFAQIALRTGAPIIPVSVVGSEELYPMLANVGPLARLIGMPYFPVTPTFPLLGPFGMLPLPSSWMIEFHEPISVDDLGPAAAEDAGAVMRLTDRVRDVIQDGVYRNLELRGSIFAGGARSFPAPSAAH